jgi:NAD(P)-dependent dehydrogenase (short-subunit alcohol dehydrogenase family)
VTRSAIVTGAASGIGLATTKMFAARGYQVVGVDLDVDALRELAGVTPLAGDVTDSGTSGAAVGLAVEMTGRLDVAVLNAGVGGAPALDHPDAIEGLDRVLAVNVRGVAHGMAAAIPVMRAAGGGAITVTASVAGLRGDPYTWAYNAAKAAAINLVRAAAIDYGHVGIRVNAIAPGLTMTPRTAGLAPDVAAAFTRTIPLQRWATADEQAEVVFFLSGPAASYVTGAVLPCDGGMSANNGFVLPPPASQDYRRGVSP